MVLLGIGVVAVNAAPSSATKYPIIKCGEGTTCHKKVQNALDKVRKKHNVVGMGMSISLPAEKGGFQKTLNFYSGTTTKNGNIAVGPGHDLLGQGSITKSFIAAVILQLAAENKLSLTDKLGQYFNTYPDWGEVTIKELLNMTSGIYNYTESPKWLAFFQKNPEYQWKWFELVGYVYYHKPKNSHKRKNAYFFPPGPGSGHWHYSNTNYILAGRIIELVTHSTLKDVLNERLLGKNAKLASSTWGPLNHTHYLPGPYPPKIMRQMIHEYTPKGVDETSWNMSVIGAAGANISNTEDIIRWTRLLYQTNQVLAPDQEKHLKSLICADPKSEKFGETIAQVDTTTCSEGFGLGIGERVSKYGRYWDYTGSTGSASSSYVLNQKTNINIAINQSTGDSVKAQEEVYSMVYRILLASKKPKR